MDRELARCVEALRRPLLLAAADRFAGLRRVKGLGHALRAACDGLMKQLESEQLAAWRVTLAGWEQLAEEQQEIEIARGMRLIALLPRISAAPITQTRPSNWSLPGEKPAAKTDPPAAKTDTLAAKTNAPTAKSEKPPAKTDAPAAKTDKPTTKTDPPATKTHKPTTKSDTPATKTDTPTAKSETATTKTDRPARGTGAAPATTDPLGAPTHSLPGIGPAFAERLAEKGLETVEDLLWCLPRRYDDVRDAKPLGDVERMDEGARATFSARVTSSRMVFVRGRRWAEVRIAALDPVQGTMLGGAGNASAVIRWFNVWAGIEKRMPAGSVVTLSGVVKKRSGRLEFANPDILAIDIPDEPTATSGARANGAGANGAGASGGTNGAGANGAGASGGANGPRAKKPLPTIIARYPEVAGVPASRLRTACQTACERVGAIADDGVPKTIEAAAQMPSLRETLAMLHSPPAEISVEDLAALNRGDSAWQRRLAFGELFALGVAVALRRRERRQDAAVPCPRSAGLDDELACALPFALTAAQRRSIREMGDDLVREVPMNRLLQGDVGAGKTAVAFAAALHVARAGRQVAIMAPTEILAEQHAETWKRWAALINDAAKSVTRADVKRAEVTRAEVTRADVKRADVKRADVKRADVTRAEVKRADVMRPLRVELLTASTQKGVRQSLLALLAAGQIDILIGTHSLIAEGVGFAGLGLVVIDEQHRFGVAQRAKLRDKGDGQGAPHLLVMTATPIPRTLALTAYGDLDVSILDELPPGREPVQTKVIAGKRGEAAAYKLIAERVAMGERAYVVCPKVEDDGESEVTWKDATTVASEISAALPQLRVGLVHGRLDVETRDRVMRAFKHGELDVLVATTVIEVGVDVPEATVMVIHDAERFGLAQLHQLRGRVGRGTGNAHCVLVTHGGISEDGRRRLDAMVATTDGFRIAEEDLALRGPGELLGPRQAGAPRLRFGSLQQHTELLLEARRHAEQILDEDPDLVRPEHVALRHALTRRLAQSVYGAESG